MNDVCDGVPDCGVDECVACNSWVEDYFNSMEDMIAESKATGTPMIELLKAHPDFVVIERS